MNPSTERALERALKALARPPRRRKGTRAPVVIGTAVVLAHLLLTRLLPAVWAAVLPGGLAAAGRLRGWPGLVWRLATSLPRSPVGPLALGVAIAVIGYAACRSVPLLRWPFRLAAVLAVALAAAILYVTMATAYEAALTGLGSPESIIPELDAP
jgi:hypothetical protein